LQQYKCNGRDAYDALKVREFIDHLVEEKILSWIAAFNEYVAKRRS